MEKGKATNADLWFLAGYVTAVVAMYLASKISEFLASEAVVYTIPPASENGKKSETGDEVTSLVKEYTEHE
jgi:hypothetical protein